MDALIDHTGEPAVCRQRGDDYSVNKLGRPWQRWFTTDVHYLRCDPTIDPPKRGDLPLAL